MWGCGCACKSDRVFNTCVNIDGMFGGEEMIAPNIYVNCNSIEGNMRCW